MEDMIIITPTKYTKKIFGKSWTYYTDWRRGRVETRFLFFRRVYNNKLCRVKLGHDTYYHKDHSREGGYTYGGAFYASGKVCVIGIGETFEEAVLFGKEHNSKFAKFRGVEIDRLNIAEVYL
jgi:hypothetical protein